MAARKSPSLAATAVTLAAIAAAIVAITADSADVPKADAIYLPEPTKHGMEYTALGFDPTDLQPAPQSGGRQRRVVSFASPDIIFHSPVLLDTAVAGVPGSGFNITFSPRINLSYTLLDFYLLNAGTFSGSVLARNVAVTNTSWEYSPPS